MRRPLFYLVKITVALAYLCATLLAPAYVNAYSAYGTGTISNPYRIATCSQLEEIDNNLGANYIVVANIDCSGSTFSHLANNAAFSGTLDGHNHTITHLNTDAYGLFYQTNGATVKNLNISSGNAYGISYAGGFVALATNTTLSNVHSGMSVSSGSGGKVGGIAGVLYGSSAISASSFTGTVTADGYAGGIVGVMQDGGTSLIDSFVGGAYYTNGGYFGTVVGGLLGGSVSRVYSTGALHLNNQISNGGIIGYSQALLRDSFSVALMSGNPAQNGGVTGSNASGSYINVFFDQSLAGTSNVCGSGSGCTATAVNLGGTSPDYFKNSTSAGPLSTWDFSNIWAVTSTYPTLRNIAIFSDNAGVPNGGDANEDGITDSYQPTVISVADGGGAWVTAQIPTNNTCSLDNAQAVDSYSSKDDAGYTPQTATMTSFDIFCPSIGMTVPVTLIYDKQYDISKSVLRHYNPSANTYSTVSGASFGTKTVGGVVKTTVTYNITDGGAYDTDGTSNGIIKDPVGMEIIPANIGAPNTGLPHKSSTALAALSIFGTLNIIGALYVRRKA